MHYDDYVSLGILCVWTLIVGGEENVKKAGKLYVEGPSYVCQNYDILYYHIRKCCVCCSWHALSRRGTHASSYL